MKRTVAVIVQIILHLVEAFAWHKYELPCDENLLKASRLVLFREVGTHEQSNRNDGREIEKYLEPLNLPKGSAYCVAGQYYCFHEAVKLLRYPIVSNPLPRTGSSMNLFLYAKLNGTKGQFQTSVDDLVVWQRGKSRFGHTERIIEVQRKGWIKTVGFNTKKYDSRQKRWVEGVFLWKRNLLYPLGGMHLVGIVGFRKVKNVHRTN